MLTGVAFLPHPPVLVPELAHGAAPELDGLRTACREAIRAAAGGARCFVLVGAGPHSRVHPSGTRGTFAGFGVPREVSLGVAGDDGPQLPLSLALGAWLLADTMGEDAPAIGFEVGPDWAFGPACEAFGPAVSDEPGPVALLVLGDGSARRSTAAPGYLDTRAADFDAGLSTCLAAGSGDRLHVGLTDPERWAGDLLAPAVPVWDAVSSTLEGLPWDATVHYDDAPYGVGYFVASWVPRRDG